MNENIPFATSYIPFATGFVYVFFGCCIIQSYKRLIAKQSTVRAKRINNYTNRKKYKKVEDIKMDNTNNEAVSNRTAAIMYGLSALIWIGCMGLNIKAIMAGTEDSEDIYIITAMTILSLLLMVHYIKNYVIHGRIHIGFRESFRIYFEGLRMETSRRKLYAPIFIGLTIGLNIVMPIALFIVDVLIKHKPMHQMDIVSTVFAASIFSLIYAVLASGNNSKKVKENSDVC